MGKCARPEKDQSVLLSSLRNIQYIVVHVSCTQVGWSNILLVLIWLSGESWLRCIFQHSCLVKQCSPTEHWFTYQAVIVRIEKNRFCHICFTDVVPCLMVSLSLSYLVANSPSGAPEHFPMTLRVVSASATNSPIDQTIRQARMGWQTSEIRGDSQLTCAWRLLLWIRRHVLGCCCCQLCLPTLGLLQKMVISNMISLKNDWWTVRELKIFVGEREKALEKTLLPSPIFLWTCCNNTWVSAMTIHTCLHFLL